MQVAAKQGDNVKQQQFYFLPRLNETVDATTETFIYRVRMPESHVEKLTFSRARDDGLLAWVDGVISTRTEDTDVVKKEEADSNEKKTSVPTLLPLPDDLIKGHRTVRGTGFFIIFFNRG